jgi:hypothetical protein
MATFSFHNNYHRSNHHTVALSGFPESAKDPIASEDYPFQGIFYNYCTDRYGNFLGLSNSFNWRSTYVTTKNNYIEWGKYVPLFTYLNSNSANYLGIKSLYLTVNSLSSNWYSSYQTSLLNSPYWNYRLDGYQVYSDLIQQYTAQKTFSANYSFFEGVDNFIWDLSSYQVAFYLTTNNFYFSGFSGGKKGGIYDLLIVTDNTCYTELSVLFDPDKFKFKNNKNAYKSEGINATKYKFLHNGNQLISLKDPLVYNLEPPDRNVYYAGAGILLYDNYVITNPITLDYGEILFNHFAGGLTIDGVEPYSSSSSVIVDGKIYNKDFIFSFTAVSAVSSNFYPYSIMGSQDRVFIENPNITLINTISSKNEVVLPKCDTYENIQIVTKAYGYISELIINDEDIKDFEFNLIDGYNNHETGHIITRSPRYDRPRVQSFFIKFDLAAPLLYNSLSSNILLWLDAKDYSTVDFVNQNNHSFIVGLSSRLSGYDVNFSSTTKLSAYYNTSSKQSFNYNLSTTHFSDLVLSGDSDFVTFTLLTPSISSKNTEWLWANANYGIFKIANECSLGIGTSAQYYKYDYGYSNKDEPILVTTRYQKNYDTQETFINSNYVTNLIQLTANLISQHINNNYTTIGGLNPLTGFSNYKLHELLLIKGYHNDEMIGRVNNYIFDKWKFL